MNGQEITLKTVSELREQAPGESLHFFIPAYQRGFRWAPLQVTQLLEDIRDFTHRKNPQPEEFYCLQPLVIKAHEGYYEVVDGQQRLTTLLLILRHFNDRLAEKYQQPLFNLNYETRPKLDAFLANPDEEIANDNVDFYHLYKAILAIEEWFSHRDNEVETIKSALLNNTKVIWFKLADSDNPVNAFTRLNVGKIPLTNDELIRALFLRRLDQDETDATNLQLKIAYEWDQLEKGLQSDAFWFFLNNQPGPMQNRIGFLFNLVTQEDVQTSNVNSDGYEIFYAFNRRLGLPESSPEEEWLKVKQTYLILAEWFEDRELFHMVGLLVNDGMLINRILKRSAGCTKSAFNRWLRSEIFQRTIGEDLVEQSDKEAIEESVNNRLESLSYDRSPSSRIKSLLLLFNLTTLLQDPRSNMRFQFDSFKSQRWDIEHIRSVTDDKPGRHHDRRRWLSNCLTYFQSNEKKKELIKEIKAFEALSQGEATDEMFDLLFSKVLKHFVEAKEPTDIHGLSNLTLLDEKTNRGYKNAVFAVKRQCLLDLDQSGIFVPLCTRNAFLKCYSPEVGNVLRWSEKDSAGYKKAIASTLVNFFYGNMEGVQ